MVRTPACIPRMGRLCGRVRIPTILAPRTFARKFSNRQIFFKFLLWSDNELYYLRREYKKVGVTDFISEIKRVENYPDFEKLAHVI